MTPVHVQAQASRPANATQIDVKDFSDFSIVTGADVSRTRLDQILSDRDTRAAMQYLEKKRLRFNEGGIVDAHFRRISTKENYSVVFLPFVEQPPIAGTPQYLVMVVRGPKSTKVSVGAIAASGKELTAPEDDAVADGKIISGQGSLKNFVKCALPGCGAAVGCFLLTGIIACFCAWCGGGAIVCAALEVLWP